MFEPDHVIYEKYAAVLVKGALHGGTGVKAGDVVECIFPEAAKPLAKEIYRHLLQAGAHPLMQMIPEGFEEDFYRHGQTNHMEWFPDEYLAAKAKLITHHIYITDPVLAELSPEELLRKEQRRGVLRTYDQWLEAKAATGDYSWTMAIWPTEKAAHLVGMSLAEYWAEVIIGCQLNEADPVKKWQETFTFLKQTCHDLTNLNLRQLRVKGEDVDLTFSLIPETKWLGGRGKNIPSYEVFTSPNCWKTEGWIRSNQVLLRGGAAIVNPEFHFEAGTLTKATASKGQSTLDALLQTPGMDRVGEISLTDKRSSPISKPLGLTLFDENLGGEFGNFHLALGNSFHDAFNGSHPPQSEAEWQALGFNSSKAHADFVSTSDREVTATLESGEERVIYKDGQFQ
jgi:aminopeptidase